MSDTGKNDEYKAPVKKADTGRDLSHSHTNKRPIDNIKKSNDNSAKNE